MIPVVETLQDRALDVLIQSFRHNAGAQWIIKQDRRKEQRLHALSSYCLRVSISKKGAFITKDRLGVVLLFSSSTRQSFIDSMRSYIYLGQHCIGWDRALHIIDREATIRGRRFKKPHLYCWVLGVKKGNGLNTVKETRDFIFEQSKVLNLPIVAETTSPRALRLYQRYGFTIYDSWHVPSQDLTVWFIVRNSR